MAKKLLDTLESENKKELNKESKNIEKVKQDKKKEKKISNKKMTETYEFISKKG